MVDLPYIKDGNDKHVMMKIFNKKAILAVIGPFFQETNQFIVEFLLLSNNPKISSRCAERNSRDIHNVLFYIQENCRSMSLAEVGILIKVSDKDYLLENIVDRKRRI